MPGDPASRRATYEDVLQSPPNVVAEIIEGTLYQSPRPSMPHAVAASALDRGKKLGVYAEHEVSWVWFVEPLDQLVEVLSLDGVTYRIVRTASGSERVRLEPFDAVELDISVLWAR